MNIRRGDIYMADLNPVIGSEQGGMRPVIVIQNDVGNENSSTVIVAAITSSSKKDLPTHIVVEAEGLSKRSTVLLEQIRTIDKQRLDAKVGQASKQDMLRLDDALRISVSV